MAFFMETFFVYAIQSQHDGRIYVGMTHDILQRMAQHNAGKTRSTKAYRPWTLLFQKQYHSRAEARIGEKYYQSGCGKEFLKKTEKRGRQNLRLNQKWL